MRIAHYYADLLSEGGCSSNVRSLSKAQTSLGHEVIGFGFDEPRARRYPEATSVVTAPKSVRGIRKLVGQMTAGPKRPDVVTVWSPLLLGNEYAMARLSRAGIPVVLSLQGHLDPFLYRSGRALRKRAYRRLALVPALRRWVTDVHAQSPYEALLAEGLGFRGRTHVFPLGTPSDAPATARPGPLRRALGLSGDDLLLGFFGRFDPIQKRFGTLVAGLARARQLSDAGKAHFVIAGKGSAEQRRATMDLLKEHNLADVVPVVGPFDGEDRFHALADIDVLLHPSRFEGLPRVIREAAAVGTPAIVTINTNAELLARAGGALLIEPSAEVLGRAIFRVAEDEGWRTAAAAAAKAWASANDWMACAHAFGEVYERAVNMPAHE